MTLALRSPEIINDIVSVDNAPIDAALLSNFGKYIQGMKKIEEAGVTRQAEADKILVNYEEVSTTTCLHAWPTNSLSSLSLFDNSSSAISTDLQTRRPKNSKYH
jgi:hypothetical protein